ncbi:MAG: hypothetical protein ACRECU_10940 [Methylocella sp.]
MSRFALGRDLRLLPPVDLLRLAAAKVRPQCSGEAKTLGGLARSGRAGQNRISAIRHGPVIGAGQAHDFGLSKSFTKQPAAPAEIWRPNRNGTRQRLLERHAGQGKAPQVLCRPGAADPHGQQEFIQRARLPQI